MLALARLPQLAATVAVFQAWIACGFETSPENEARDRVARRPVAESVANDGWLDTLDQSQAPVALRTPNGRAEDPARPQRTGSAAPQPQAAPFSPARFRTRETRQLGQWTGRSPNPVDSLGFSGTDLGVGFAHRGQLWFLFGDSQSAFEYTADSLAVASIAPFDPSALPRLAWIVRPSGLFAPFSVPGVDLGYMNVPVEGVSLGGTAYVFVAGGWSSALGQHRISVLAHRDPADLAVFERDYTVESKHFLNVSALVEGAFVYIWGSGEFRKSDVYLARVRTERFADRSQWEYLHSFDAEGPTFVASEDDARPVVSAGCVGELSVRKHPQLGLFMLAYNCEWPRGVFLHTAEAPAGPYSQPISIFDPWRDHGYEHFIHVSPAVSGRDDGLSDPGREDQSGGEYGPYLVPEWFSDEPGGGHAIIYTLSSWNPYQVSLMRTVLVDANTPPAPFTGADLLPAFGTIAPAIDLALGDASGWSHEGDGFAIYLASDGSSVIASDAAPLGAAATGTFWHDFAIDSTISLLAFEIQGGDAEVLLIADDEVVRRAHGRSDLAWSPVVFQLAELRGKALRVALYDRSTESAVRVRNMQVF